MVNQTKLGLAAAMLLGQAMAGNVGGRKTAPSDPLDGIDLEAEYEHLLNRRKVVCHALNVIE